MSAKQAFGASSTTASALAVPLVGVRFVASNGGPVALGFADQFEVDPHRAGVGGVGAAKRGGEIAVGIFEPAIEYGGSARGERRLSRFDYVGNAEDRRI